MQELFYAQDYSYDQSRPQVPAGHSTFTRGTFQPASPLPRPPTPISIPCGWDDCQHMITVRSAKKMRKRLNDHFQDQHPGVDLTEKRNEKPCQWTECRCTCHRGGRCVLQGGRAAHPAHTCDLLNHLWKIHVQPKLGAEM
jgi:hypothetical protein